jgi:hypothetical protein
MINCALAFLVGEVEFWQTSCTRDSCNEGQLKHLLHVSFLMVIRSIKSSPYIDIRI